MSFLNNYEFIIINNYENAKLRKRPPNQRRVAHNILTPQFDAVFMGCGDFLILHRREYFFGGRRSATDGGGFPDEANRDGDGLSTLDSGLGPVAGMLCAAHAPMAFD